ncbi:MAG: hypothetical protein WC966_06260 [Bradymonadales bacterium]
MLADNKDAQYIYENIIFKEDLRILAVDCSEDGKAALRAYVKDIEAYCEGKVDLSNEFLRQSIGRMVSESMNLLGYKKIQDAVDRELPGAKFFKTASIYALDTSETPPQKIIRCIVDNY